MKRKKSWKTTLGGIIAAMGVGISKVEEPFWMSILGETLLGLGTFLIGWGARDNGVSSQDVGIR